jgi:hypothetical protein
MRSETLVGHPVHRVFWAYRDRLPEAASTVPGIQGVEVKSRHEEGDIVRIHNVWTSDSEIPAFAQRFLTPEHQSWDDHAVWFESNHRCEWNIKPRIFRDAVVCIGTTRFVAEGSATRVVLSGELKVDVSVVPGVPDVLADTIAPKIENYIIGTVQPRIEANNVAIEGFLDRQKPSF